MGVTLYYWPMIPGRGEFVRWILEDAGVDYVDVARIDGVPAIFAARREGIELASGRRVRIFAPPALATDDHVLFQTAVIAQYVGETYGRAPADAADRWDARGLMNYVMDVVKEAHDVHHPVSMSLTYEQQAAESLRAAEAFHAHRLPRHLQFFEARLAQRDGPYLFGAEPSYADLALVPLLRGLDHAFPKAMSQADTPHLRALRDAVQERPNLVAYRKSDRCLPYGEHGVFRYYAELDVPEPS